MKTSQLYLPTLKESPADAEVISHKLMLRAGMIRKLASGIYTWLPLGLRVLRKVETIVREEMNRIGAQEILMPNIQPSELWEESERWEKYGPDLLRIKDRHERLFCFGPTHEEVITDLVRHELRSYKELPATFYQIQTKFRDEIRPRFGVLRGREFLMKDAYSFHIDKASLEKTYEAMFEAYTKIFSRLGLIFRPVLADTGNIGGSVSQEFQVLTDTGEDLIFYSDESNYAANVEQATSLAPSQERQRSNKKMEIIETPNKRTIQEVSTFLNIDPRTSVKMLLVKGNDQPVVGLILRGDHEANPIKIEKFPQIAKPFTLIDDAQIEATINGCPAGYIGPVGLSIPMIVDRDAAGLTDFVCGANQKDKHYKNVNWERDLPLPQVADIRKVVVGDLSPDGKGKLQMTRGIEVGQVFQLGTKYSVSMNACVTDENGKQIPMEMGCYGIGVSRTVGAAIEQNNDERGIIWPLAMAPFSIVIVPINFYRSEQVRKEALKLYEELTQQNFEVLLDDRDERPGVLFSDMELIGIPHRVVIGEKGLNANTIEYQGRRDTQSQQISKEKIIEFLKEKFKLKK